MKTSKLIGLALAAALLPSALAAQTITWQAAAAPVPNLGPLVQSPGKARVIGVVANRKWLMPFFAVDTGGWDTTLIALRNVSGNDMAVLLRYYGEDGAMLFETVRKLPAKQVMTEDLQNRPQLVDREGFMVIETPSPGLVGDYFNLSAPPVYALSGRILPWSELGQLWQTRYLMSPPNLNSAFRIWVERPLGEDTSLPPTFAVNLYDEPGRLLGTVFGWMSSRTGGFLPKDLFDVLQSSGIPVTAPFGALEIAFLSGKGVVLGEAYGNQQLHTTLPAECLVR